MLSARLRAERFIAGCSRFPMIAADAAKIRREKQKAQSEDWAF
ncbi:hypothetical protein [Paraburkholderia lycopersici]|nr:hypothetical protein [Paraburkholderia lycopersici]